MATGCAPTTKTTEDVETTAQNEAEYETLGVVVNPAEFEVEFMSKDTVEEQESPIEGSIEEVSEEILAQFERKRSGDSDVQIDGTIVYSVAEKQPEFPGGEKAMESFIKKNLRYPGPDCCAQGRVSLSFIVETDGSISNIKVLRSPAEELTQEAIRIVKLMPKWKPGKMRDIPVRVKYVLPVTFRLE